MERLGAREDREAVVRNLIGPKIRQRRLALGWSQAKLGEQIGRASGEIWLLSDQDIRRIEARRKIVIDREIPFIAAALGCSVAWLLGEDGAPEPPPTAEKV